MKHAEYWKTRFVSIHAPVKGATDTDQPGHDIDDVSIHAPVKGATIIRTILTNNPIVFQSTHP